MAYRVKERDRRDGTRRWIEYQVWFGHKIISRHKYLKVAERRRERLNAAYFAEMDLAIEAAAREDGELEALKAARAERRR